MPATPDDPRPRGAEPHQPVPLAELARGLAATAPSEPLLVRLVQAPPGGEVALLPIAEIDPLADHPADFLVGFEAPADWSGIGIVATGRLHHLGAAHDDVPQPVAICHLADRSGAQATAVTDLAGDEPAAPAEGRVPDLLRRSLDLPLAKAVRGPATWIDQCWLDAILWLAAAHGPSPRWRAVSRLHPLRPPGGVPDPASLHECTAAAEAGGWGPLLWSDPVRAAAEAGFTAPAELATSLLDWVGPDVVGRWLLQQYPPADELLEAVESLVDECTARAIRAALAS